MTLSAKSADVLAHYLLDLLFVARRAGRGQEPLEKLVCLGVHAGAAPKAKGGVRN